MIFAGALILVFVAISWMAIDPRRGMLALLIIKPITDAAYLQGIFGIRIPEILGGLVPIVFFCRILMFRDDKQEGLPLVFIWVMYVFTNIIGSAMILTTGKFRQAFELIFLIFHGVVGFYMFQFYVRDKVQFQRLLIVILVAGLFPMLMGAYQAATGVTWQLRHTAGGLVRNVGVYHDVFNFRSLAQISIAAILLYWVYFSKGRLWTKIFLFAYAINCSVVVFKAYSKAGYVIFGLWVVVWAVLNRKIGWLLAIIVAVIGINFAMGNMLFDDVATVFYKETAAIEGTGETKFILSGRLTVWEKYLKEWHEFDVIQKIFGAGRAGGTAHNDYIRALISGGVVGLSMYIILLAVIGWKVAVNLFRDKNPLNILAFMIFLMWIVDTIGLVPSLYPAYQWYVWGFIGLALRGVDGLHGQSESVEHDFTAAAEV